MTRPTTGAAGTSEAADPKRIVADGEPSDATDPKRIVADGYDRIAERYLAWSALRPSSARRAALELADRLIPAGADVLELG